MLPTTSSDPEGFRSRPIAFWKALEPLSKAYISTSTLHCDLRISNGHTACGCERGYRRRRGIDGAAETDVAEAGAYGHSAPDSLATYPQSCIGQIKRFEEPASLLPPSTRLPESAKSSSCDRPF